MSDEGEGEQKILLKHHPPVVVVMPPQKKMGGVAEQNMEDMQVERVIARIGLVNDEAP